MYAIGVLLWEMFTGRIPWDTYTNHEIMTCLIVKKKGLPLINVGIPKTIRNLIRDLLDVPEKRPSAAATLDALIAFKQQTQYFTNEEIVAASKKV